MSEIFDARFDAFLFDMDGTILTSIVSAERAWSTWARRFDLDLDSFLPTIHGRRAIETIAAQNLPGINVEAEAALLLQLEMDDVEGIAPIGGAADFLAALPADKWALVTSAPKTLALKRLEAAGLPVPPMMVTADDVTTGKPAPDCFLMGAERLGVDPKSCLVFEDADAGIKAGEAAGSSVLVITETHHKVVDHGHPSIVNYDGIRPVFDGGKLSLSKG
ncbi:HAD-IA family hydrolase [Rhizobium halophytocola]|uniref:Sugar-phosphatase n=1 Tax=Rhizobium halophytocola TaxID=735519 RepID=A0ABS4E5Y9_9HYPH|nr:HAD-IA family hydrolase [Rhizobium halophytocola]MBP1853366.1 sugar-phosphatase [Rhizobium halophytocola]